MNDSAKLGYRQLVPTGPVSPEETWEPESQQWLRDSIFPHLIQVRKVLFSEEAGE